jgi:phage baseplate assembly protein gpV
MNFETAEMRRTIENLFLWGKVTKSLPESAEVFVRIDDEIEVGPIPFLSPKGGGEASLYFPLSEGDLVFLCVPQGDFSEAVVLGSSFRQGEAPKTQKGTTIKFKDGAELSYEPEGKTLSLKAPSSGVIRLEVKGKVELKADEVSLGDPGEADKGVVTGSCVCAFTGAPHPEFSKVVKAKK